MVRGGGKVVKNVAGYDLPKLAIGSFGTLGVIVDATFKLRPRPEADRLAVIGFERLKDAGQAARAVMGSDLIPSAVELLDREALGALGGAGVAVSPDGGAVLVGLDGTPEQVEWQCAELPRVVGGLGATATRAARRRRTGRGMASAGRAGARRLSRPAAVMKLGVLPTQVAEVMEQGAGAAQRSGLRAAFSAHAGVGIVSAALAGDGAEAGTVVAVLGEWRAMAAGAGGHALLEWAPLAVKERVPVWDPPGARSPLHAADQGSARPRGHPEPWPVPGRHLTPTMARGAALASGPLTLHGLDVEGVHRCVHCGLCLASCPTFAELGTEMDSPRGRIFTIKSLAEGRISLSDRRRPTSTSVSGVAPARPCARPACLRPAHRGGSRGDRAPAAGGAAAAAVPLAQLHGAAPEPAAARRRRGRPALYQASGLRRLARASGLLRLLPYPLSAWEPLLPELPPRRDRAPLPERIPAVGARRGTVGLLAGCIQQVAFGPQNRATARVLARNGAEVVVPPDQACCGALHAHAGEHSTALALARRTIAAFERAGVDEVVVNTSGCGAHMKSYGALLAGDPAWAERAAASQPASGTSPSSWPASRSGARSPGSSAP